MLGMLAERHEEFQVSSQRYLEVQDGRERTLLSIAAADHLGVVQSESGTHLDAVWEKDVP
jgi:hypothetical protein